MTQVRKVELPPGTLAAALPFRDHVDAFQVAVDRTRFPDVDSFAKAFLRGAPAWIRGALRMRDAMVSVFGLKTSSTSPIPGDLELTPGVRVGIFRVIDRNDDEIVFGEDDRHLDFRVSILFAEAGNETSVTVTTLVRFHNAWGRAYFTPVKPAHGLIVPAMIRAAIA